MEWHGIRLIGIYLKILRYDLRGLTRWHLVYR
jgi:hypothetical protein